MLHGSETWWNLTKSDIYVLEKNTMFDIKGYPKFLFENPQCYCTISDWTAKYPMLRGTESATIFQPTDWAKSKYLAFNVFLTACLTGFFAALSNLGISRACTMFLLNMVCKITFIIILTVFVYQKNVVGNL